MNENVYMFQTTIGAIRKHTDLFLLYTLNKAGCDIAQSLFV